MFHLERAERERGVVEEVVRGWSRAPPDLCIVSKEGHALYTQRALLGLHSPLLATLLSSSPSSSSLPALSLPLSSASLVSLLSILASGQTNTDNSLDLMELVRAADLLGITIEDLQIVQPLNKVTQKKKSQYETEEILQNNVVTKEDNVFENDPVGVEQISCEIEQDVKEEVVVNTKRESKTLNCTLCPQTFKRLEKLEEHELMHSNTSIVTFPCDVCNKVFPVKGRLKLHMFSHTGEKPFKCGFCEKAFNQSVNMKRHQKEMHDESMVQCSFCEKQFKNDRYLKGHIEHSHKSSIV